MKNLLVPTDFSDVSKNALKFAIKIAHAMNGKIIIFHTEQPVMIASDMGGFIYPVETEDSESVAALNNKMDALVDFVKQQDVEADKVIQKGFLKDTVENLIEEEQISMVVTGTHGAKGLDAFFFGTNSMDIFEHVKCPVLIVPMNARYHSIKKIMYATDLQFGDINEIAKIARMAKPFNAEIIVTHVNTDVSKMGEEKDNMDWFAEISESKVPYKHISYKLIYHKNVLEALENNISALGIDLICMSTLEKDFFKNLVSKSNTREMAYHSSIPLLALHLDKENKLS